MEQLPSPEVYEQESLYMPWGKLEKEIQDFVVENAPQDGSLVDLMCGPGSTLNKIHSLRPDLQLTGVDIDSRYTEYGSQNYPGIDFVTADGREWSSDKKYDAVLCMAGLHHLPYEDHEKFIEKISGVVNENGFVILADPYLSHYSNDRERQLAAAELGYEYLKAVIENNAPDEIVSAAVDILRNDVLPNGEYKTHIDRVRKMVEARFAEVELHKTWPDKDQSGFGDYYWILKRPKSE